MKSIFERIRDLEIPTQFLYESETVMAFLDISQATKGHTLIVSKHAYKNIHETPLDVISEMFRVSKIVVEALNKSFNPLGYNYLSNQGSVSGQSIFHVHLHVIPRYDEKDIDLHFHKTTINSKDVFAALKPFINAEQ
jgi:histidine triad (HIT) family protein